MKKSICALVLAILVTVSLSAKLSGQVSDEFGQPLIARLRFISAERKFLTTIYTDWQGTFEVDLPVGEYEMEVTKGPEYERKLIRINVEEDEHKIIVLRRLFDLTEVGWFSGDTHLHTFHSDGKNSVEELALACSAAGLSWAVLSDHNTLVGASEWLSFREKGLLTIVGQEVTMKNGHANAIGIEKLIPWQRSQSDEEMIKIFEMIKIQNGFVQINHPFDLRSPFEKLHLEGYDLIEIWNGGGPPNLLGFRNNESKEHWFKMLNEGRRVAAVAASDCHDVYSTYSLAAFLPMFLVVQLAKKDFGEYLETAKMNEEKLRAWVLYGLFPGTPRTYVRVNELTQQEILRSLKSGKSFMTNGPLLLVALNGAGPGETATIEKESLLQVKIFSNVPVNKLSVIKNGELVHEIPVELENGEFKHLKALDLSEGDWILVEVFGDFPVYAITNPIYISKKQK